MQSILKYIDYILLSNVYISIIRVFNSELRLLKAKNLTKSIDYYFLYSKI